MTNILICDGLGQRPYYLQKILPKLGGISPLEASAPKFAHNLAEIQTQSKACKYKAVFVQIDFLHQWGMSLAALRDSCPGAKIILLHDRNISTTLTDYEMDGHGTAVLSKTTPDVIVNYANSFLGYPPEDGRDYRIPPNDNPPGPDSGGRGVRVPVGPSGRGPGVAENLPHEDFQTSVAVGGELVGAGRGHPHGLSTPPAP